MDQKRISSVWVALMGVLIGVLLAITWQSALRSPTRKIRVGASSKIDLVLDQIQKRYVDTVDTGKLTEAAIVAALAELDPHSVYMPPVLLEESETELAGNFDGIGIQFNVPNDTAIVLEVIPGGPSEKIGLLPGDRILRVDDKTIAGVQFPQDSMVRRMKGPAGTKVLITVRREHGSADERSGRHQGAHHRPARRRRHSVRNHPRQDPGALRRCRLHGKRYHRLYPPVQIHPHHLQ